MDSFISHAALVKASQKKRKKRRGKKQALLRAFLTHVENIPLLEKKETHYEPK